MSFKKFERITPAQIIILGFLALIAVGTLLLMLPCATRQPGGASFIDALFTATSSTCVTGLILHDTALYWTGFGQFIIMLLIQIGGMGVVTIAITILMFSGQKIGLKQRWVMQETLNAPQVGGVIRLTGFILKAMLAIEFAGAVLMAIRFCPEFGILKGLWYAVFHSISAFCNAGFDLMGINAPFSSLTHYAADPLINGTVCLLIILGGLGFITWHDITSNKLHFKNFRLQTKLILCTTAILLVGGFLFFFLYEFNQPQWQQLTTGERIAAAAFQAVSPRTAGFNTVDLSAMTEPGIFFTIILMLVGGSPGSTAGGFKTTTLAIMILSIRAVFRQKGSTECFGRRIATTDLQKAAALFILYIMIFLISGIAICCIENIPLLTALFETASAIGTVGLSLGLTPELSTISHVILIILMYCGRVGGLTMLYMVTNHNNTSHYPQENIAIG